jgi:hypothetical protein
MGHEKEFFLSNHISFKLVATVVGKDSSKYWLVANKNQRHLHYNNWYLTVKWSQEKQEEKAILFKVPIKNQNLQYLHISTLRASPPVHTFPNLFFWKNLIGRYLDLF